MQSMRNKFTVIALTTILTFAVTWPREPEPPPAPPEPVGAGLPEIVALRPLAKVQLVRDVTDGRRTLWEAAALFGALDRLSPAPPTPPGLPDASLPDPERLCGRVIGHVEAALANRPEWATEMARLEVELRRALGLPGGLQLPEPRPEKVADLLNQSRERLAQIRRRAGFP